MSSVPKPKVLVAMSGGVDSSVAAAMLLRAGFDPVGCFMRLGSPGEALDTPLHADHADACDAPPPTNGSTPLRISKQGCCSINDAADARLVAAHLNIPLYICNFKRDFARVIDYFVDEYANGRTPNPCVRCNDWLKFGKLDDYARQLGADFVASGHYARIAHIDGDRITPRPLDPAEISDPAGRATILRGLDTAKDQSYVLFGASPERVERMILPIGEMPKAQVRALAKELGLPVFDKPDSQEICFVPDNDYAALVERQRPDLARPGEVLDEQGNVVATHQGQHRFTIGQRRGVPVALGHRIYVVHKDAATNAVTLGSREALRVASCEVGEANWLQPVSAAPARVRVQFRAHAAAVAAAITPLSDGADATPSGRLGRFRVDFDEPQEAVAPGQALVVYDAATNQIVLGGGWIRATTTPHQDAPNPST